MPRKEPAAMFDFINTILLKILVIYLNLNMAHQNKLTSLHGAGKKRLQSRK